MSTMEVKEKELELAKRLVKVERDKFRDASERAHSAKIAFEEARADQDKQDRRFTLAERIYSNYINGEANIYDLLDM